MLCCVFFISLSKLSKHAEPEPFFVSQSDPHVLTFLPPIVICTVAYSTDEEVYIQRTIGVALNFIKKKL